MTLLFIIYLSFLQFSLSLSYSSSLLYFCSYDKHHDPKATRSLKCSFQLRIFRSYCNVEGYQQDKNWRQKVKEQTWRHAAQLSFLYKLGCRMHRAGSRVQDSGSRLQGVGRKMQECGCGVQSARNRDSTLDTWKPRPKPSINQ